MICARRSFRWSLLAGPAGRRFVRKKRSLSVPSASVSFGALRGALRSARGPVQRRKKRGSKKRWAQKRYKIGKQVKQTRNSKKSSPQQQLTGNAEQQKNQQKRPLPGPPPSVRPVFQLSFRFRLTPFERNVIPEITGRTFNPSFSMSVRG